MIPIGLVFLGCFLSKKSPHGTHKITKTRLLFSTSPMIRGSVQPLQSLMSTYELVIFWYILGTGQLRWKKCDWWSKEIMDELTVKGPIAFRSIEILGTPGCWDPKNLAIRNGITSWLLKHLQQIVAALENHGSPNPLTREVKQPWDMMRYLDFSKASSVKSEEMRKQWRRHHNDVIAKKTVEQVPNPAWLKNREPGRCGKAGEKHISSPSSPARGLGPQWGEPSHWDVQEIPNLNQQILQPVPQFMALTDENHFFHHGISASS